MPQSSTFRVRFALVGILAVIALGFALSPAYSQRPIGIGGGGIGGGGIGGGGIGGGRIGGGIGGAGIGGGGIGGGGIGGIGGAGIGGGGIAGGGMGIGGAGMGMGGAPQMVWRCSRCGYTQNSPGTCPNCSGSSFTQRNGSDSDSSGGGSSSYKAGKAAGITIGVLVFIGILVAAVKAVNNSSGGRRPTKAYRRRRYRYREDD